jgi:hypothetical protein
MDRPENRVNIGMAKAGLRKASNWGSDVHIAHPSQAGIGDL